MAGGGVSVYYSHVLQMLFFSYCQGKSFAATISRTTLEVLQLFSINIKRWEGVLSVQCPGCLHSAGACPGPVLAPARGLVQLTFLPQAFPFHKQEAPGVGRVAVGMLCPLPCRPQAMGSSLGTIVTQGEKL